MKHFAKWVHNKAAQQAAVGGASRRVGQAEPEHMDDVAGLYDKLGLDPRTFQTFAHPNIVAHDAATGSECLRPRSIAGHRPVRATTGVDEGDLSATVLPLRRDPVRATVDASASSTPASRGYSMLQRLAPVDELLPQPALGIPVVGLLSRTGGVGKSTLSASLGAALAVEGRRCVMIGQTEYSPLAYYFGGPTPDAAHVAETITQYATPVAGAHHEVRFVIGDAPLEELLAPVCEMTQNATDNPELALLDIEASPRATAALSFMDIALVPMRPDLNAVLMVDDLERTLAKSEARPAGGLWYVFNQFDPQCPLHREVASRLRACLGNRLLPFELPFDSAVQEALANGVVPSVYDPACAFAGAFTHLTTWLRERLATLHA